MFKDWFVHRCDNRVFFHLGRKTLTLEGYALSKKCNSLEAQIMVSHDCENTFMFHVAIPLLFSFYIVLDTKSYAFLEKFCGKYAARSYGFYVNRESMRAWFHENPMEGPTGYSCHLEWDRVFKGKRTDRIDMVAFQCVTRVVPGDDNYESAMHNLTIKKLLHVTSYSRWKNRKLIRYEVECAEGVPHPGKGTASYNCGEDSTYSITFGAGQVDGPLDAANKFIEECMQTRKKYPL